MRQFPDHPLRRRRPRSDGNVREGAANGTAGLVLHDVVRPGRERHGMRGRRSLHAGRHVPDRSVRPGDPPGRASGSFERRLAADESTLNWDPIPGAAAGTVYDVARGLRAPKLPVGGGAAETCLAPGSTVPIGIGLDRASGRTVVLVSHTGTAPLRDGNVRVRSRPRVSDGRASDERVPLRRSAALTGGSGRGSALPACQRRGGARRVRMRRPRASEYPASCLLDAAAKQRTKVPDSRRRVRAHRSDGGRGASRLKKNRHLPGTRRRRGRVAVKGVSRRRGRHPQRGDGCELAVGCDPDRDAPRRGLPHRRQPHRAPVLVGRGVGLLRFFWTIAGCARSRRWLAAPSGDCAFSPSQLSWDRSPCRPAERCSF